MHIMLVNKKYVCHCYCLQIPPLFFWCVYLWCLLIPVRVICECDRFTAATHPGSIKRTILRPLLLLSSVFLFSQAFALLLFLHLYI
jgi:hypothetical protein